MEPRPDRIPLAILVRLASALGISTMNALVKLAEAHGARLGEILFFRQAVSVPVLALLIAAGPGLGSVRTGRIGAHAVRAATGVTGMFLLFASVTLLPLAQATTLTFSVPIFATILGALWLGEPTGWHRWAAVAAGFAGVLVVAHPWSGGFAPLGTAAGLGYAVATALVSIQLRQIGRTETPLTTVFWFATLSTPVLAIAYAVTAGPHPPLVWALLVGIGLVGSFTQLALTGALRLGPVSIVVPMDYSSLLWATLYGWALFGVLPAATTWIGAPVIVG